MDLLTGGKNHFLVMVAESAGIIEVYSTQLLHTGEIIKDVKREMSN